MPTDDNLTFSFLADHPEAIPVVAGWYFGEWGDAVPGNSVAKTIERLLGKLNRDVLPLHLLAVSSDEVVGVAQLKHHEMDLYPDKEFWLGSVYVKPEARGRGVACALCEKAGKVAKGMGIEELHLQTEVPDGGLYRRLGWKVVVGRVRYHGVEVTVMRRDLRIDPGRAEAEAALFRKVMDLPWRDAMIDWAVNCLVRGLEGTATTLLAGACAEDDGEVLDLFRKAAAEQEIELPEGGDRFVSCEPWVCGEIVAGRIRAGEGLRILNRLWVKSGHDERLSDWMWLAECIVLMGEGYGSQDPFADLTPETVDETIVREAARVAGRDPHLIL